MLVLNEFMFNVAFTEITKKKQTIFGEFKCCREKGNKDFPNLSAFDAFLKASPLRNESPIMRSASSTR